MQLYFVQSSDRRGDEYMKDVVLDELKKELNWKERIVVKLFTKTMKKMYTEGVKKGFNWNFK